MGAKIRHGNAIKGKITSEWRLWSHIKDRCRNPNNAAWKHYGGRGIDVWQPWFESFERFLADVGRKPGPEYSLDRWPNNNGNYEPGNVRWATKLEQMRNMRRNRMVTYNSQTRSLAEWAEVTGIGYGALKHRLKKGLSLEYVFSAKPGTIPQPRATL